MARLDDSASRGAQCVCHCVTRGALELSRRSGSVWRIAECLEAVVHVVAAYEQWITALHLAGAVAAHRDHVRSQPTRLVRSALDNVLARARQSLGEAAVHRAWVHGSALSMEEAVEEALPLVGG